jgi:hypothetical protein
VSQHVPRVAKHVTLNSAASNTKRPRVLKQLFDIFQGLHALIYVHHAIQMESVKPASSTRYRLADHAYAHLVTSRPECSVALATLYAKLVIQRLVALNASPTQAPKPATAYVSQATIKTLDHVLHAVILSAMYAHLLPVLSASQMLAIPLTALVTQATMN